MKLRIYNNTLDPNIWDEGKVLKPDVKDALLKIAEDFYKNTDLKGSIHNILFLGSSANYNWTDASDIDLHIVIDITEQNINKEYARKFMDGLAFKWNTDHDLKIKGHPVEVYLQDISEPNSSPELARPGAAIYSIYDDKWLLEPNRENVKVDAHKIRRKYQDIKERIDQLIQTEDVEKLKSLMTSIRNYRNAGMMAGGEFSVENIVFKSLRHSGALEKLKTAVTDIYDRKASLPEEGNRPHYKKTQPLTEHLVDRHANLYLGVIKRSNFKVVGTDVQPDEEGADSGYTHDDFLRDMGGEWDAMWDDAMVRWRYKRSENSIYWWYARPHPTEEEKLAVEDWLMNNAGANENMSHKWISQADSIVKRHPDYYKNRWASHDPSVDH